ncbi:MGMT family protein [Paeniglutamicibacter cryotolerans]|uniref:Alkylated DNA nucleotide flippase Atl1 n=1 Tax=Paeniglutamicibacter cryotolerans TaxID=670079 RepID=A0A839QL22_9MICC|nr:MGMT family protein [Paeniglutamicibacter cryotolerans]MBB2996557.1 alkylated DNA nucleotide flippase Atl1 [Paeniglutamicibacter cryotolerans]
MPEPILPPVLPDGPASAAARRAAFAEAVLAVAALVPEGSALSYGDVAELLGAGGPRQVGSVMSHYGSGVCWWRIIRSDGSLPEDLAAVARPKWGSEGTRTRNGKVRMVDARWQPTEAQFNVIDALGAALRGQNIGGR